MNLYYISDRIYPSGNAGGIRIDYLTRMFSFRYDVSVIAFNNKSKTNYISEVNTNLKVYVLPLCENNKIVYLLDRYLISGIRAYNMMKRLSIENSKIILYTTNIIFVIIILFALRSKKNNKYIFDVVENFGPNNFKFGFFNPKYYLFRILYNYLYSRAHGVFAISKGIQRDFVKKGVSSLILPPLFSSTEFLRQKDYCVEVKNFIYSGNPFGKENLELMFTVLTILLERGYSLVLHLAGSSLNDYNKYTKFEKKYPLLRKNTIIYGFLPLSDLYKIYEKMHFTFFLRDNTQSNLCNFPMKLVEMMNFGIIPIISRVGDYAQVLTNNYDAFLIENNNIDSIIERFEQILEKSVEDFSNMSINARSSSERYDFISYYKKNANNIDSFMNNI